MARKKSGGEGGNAVLVIFLVVFALAAIALGVMYWTGQEKVAAAEGEKAKAATEIKAANAAKEEADVKLLLHKAFNGTATEAELGILQSASSGDKAAVLRAEYDKLIAEAKKSEQDSIEALAKSEAGVQMLKLGFKMDKNAVQPINWPWAQGGTIDKTPSPGTIIERLTRVSYDRARAYKVAEIDRAAATKSGLDYVKSKTDYDKNLTDSKAQVAEQIKKLEDAMAKVDKEMGEEIKKYKDDTEGLRGEMKKRAAEREELQNQLTLSKVKQAGLEERMRVEDARRSAEELEKNGAFAVNLPHGTITKRNYNEKMVEIDIGSSAGLKAGQTFTIQPSSSRKEGLSKQSKGQVEVVKVNGPNEATARITGEVDDIEKVAADLSKRGAVVDGYFDLVTNTWLSPDRSVTKPGPGPNTTYVIRGWEFDSSGSPGLQKEFGDLRSTINQTVASVRSGGAQEMRALRFLNDIGYPLGTISDQSVTAAAVRFTGKSPGNNPAPVAAPK